MPSTDQRIWFRLTTEFPWSPKILGLSDHAFRTLIQMIAWSRSYMTDGVIPANVARQYWGWENQTENLVGNQLGYESVTELLSNDPVNPSLRVDESGNLVIHDYLEHQESRADVEERKRRLQANGRKGGRPKKPKQNQVGNQAGNQLANQDANLKPNLEKSRDRDRDRGEITNVISLSGNQSENTSPPTNTSGEKERKKRGTRIPEDFTITDQMRLWATSRRLSININEQTELFINYWMSTPGERGVKIDWYATWRNWMLNADKRERDKQTSRYRNQDQIMRDSYAEAARADALLEYTQQPTQNLWDDFNNQQHRLNGA